MRAGSLLGDAAGEDQTVIIIIIIFIIISISIGNSVSITTIIIICNNFDFKSSPKLFLLPPVSIKFLHLLSIAAGPHPPCSRTGRLFRVGLILHVQ